MPGMFSPLAYALCAPGDSLPLSQGGAAGGAARFCSGGAPTAPQPAHEGPLTAHQHPPSEHQDTNGTALLYIALHTDQSKRDFWQNQSVWLVAAHPRWLADKEEDSGPTLLLDVSGTREASSASASCRAVIGCCPPLASTADSARYSCAQRSCSQDAAHLAAQVCSGDIQIKQKLMSLYDLHMRHESKAPPVQMRLSGNISSPRMAAAPSDGTGGLHIIHIVSGMAAPR